MSARADLAAALAVLRLGPAYAYLADALLALNPAGARAQAAIARGDHAEALRLTRAALDAAEAAEGHPTTPEPAQAAGARPEAGETACPGDSR